jgi:hypothetical protein
MKSPFASIGLAGGNDPNDTAAPGVYQDIQPSCDPAIKTITYLAVLPSFVQLDMPRGISESQGDESERETTLAQALLALNVVPFKSNNYRSLA